MPSVPFDHLLRMTDDVGLLEHADGTVPRYEHGYCVDDVARALVVVCREPEPTDDIVILAGRYTEFLLQAQTPDGRTRNRLGYDRRWQDESNVEDCWGRAVWGLGVGAVQGPTSQIRARCMTAFERAVAVRSPYPHAMTFAALGAAAVVDHLPDHTQALALLDDAVAVIGRVPSNPAWPWPMRRLSYANAAIAEAVLSAGSKLGNDTMIDDGLRMLRWLLELETRSGHLSVTPVGGRGPADADHRFDQQPIEAAALADACIRADEVDGDSRWMAGVRLCVGWFLGDNDAKTPLLNEDTGGGCDGLHATGRNRNQGAESTIAMISVLQHGQRLMVGAR